MRSIIVLIFTLLIISCKESKKVENVEVFIPRTISKVEIETLLQDSLLNVRAIEIDDDKNIGFAGANGEIGGETYELLNDKNSVTVSAQLKHVSIVPNFRSLAITNEAGFILSISSPALLYKVDSDSIKLVYKENHEKIFYDSLDFWNDKEGIAIGDSIDGCLSIIITRDGGENWKKLSCEQLPKATENEGAFAASDTNIAIVGNKTWVATTAGRVYISNDKGLSWEIFDTPIIKDKETEGIYSIDFYDENKGFAIGGDYTKPEDNQANKIITIDGGKTWQLVGAGEGPGYRSCVQYIPNREGKELVAIGFKGIDYSNDAGYTWKHLSDEGFYTIRFLNDSVAYAAGAGRISKLHFK